MECFPTFRGKTASGKAASAEHMISYGQGSQRSMTLFLPEGWEKARLIFAESPGEGGAAGLFEAL